MARKMNGIRSNPSATSLIDAGDIIESDEDKAETFARLFASISSSANYSETFQQHKHDVETNHPDLFENNAPSSKTTDELNQILTQQELKQAIKKLKRNTATGDDKITYEFFHYIPPAGLERLLELYNTI